MRETLPVSLLFDKPFPKVTIFGFGYLAGYGVTEAKNLTFEIATNWSKKSLPAIKYVERGKRKEQLKGLELTVLVEGWDLPGLDEWEKSKFLPEGDPQSGLAIFTAFDNGWHDHLNNYLDGIRARVIYDWRTEKKSKESESTQAGIVAPALLVHPEESASVTYIEGAPLWDIVTRYERDEAARAACLAHHGYRCQVCDKTMEEIYGPIGKDFIHVHHIIPLSEIRDVYIVDPIKDLVPVCPNCHAMLHRKKETLNIEELRTMLQRAT